MVHICESQNSGGQGGRIVNLRLVCVTQGDPVSENIYLFISLLEKPREPE
jgi:hypothetical protein